MDKKKEEILTDFGYTQVSPAEKTAKVREVFESVAPKYDLMNDLMSFGIHRFWKHLTIFLSRVKPGAKVLDLAGGTGDLCKLLAKKVGENGEVILADINKAMLEVGRARVIDAGFIKNVKFVQADAQDLPFEDNCFDLITMAFGLRNVTDKNAALKSMYRVLKPGGKLMVLEFSQPTLPVVSKLYDVFSFSVLPKLGKLIANDAASYQYLAESIRKHPDQKTLLGMMQEAGFSRSDYQNLSAGIVALHTGYKDE